MKKLKVLLTIIVFFLLICVMEKPVFGKRSLTDSQVYDFPASTTALCDTYDNVYCIDKTRDCTGYYKAVTKIEINGNSAWITNLETGAASGEIYNHENNVMAAILCKMTDHYSSGWYTMGYSPLSALEWGWQKSAGNALCFRQSNAQMGLWTHWWTWAAAIGLWGYIPSEVTIGTHSCSGGYNCIVYSEPDCGYCSGCFKGQHSANQGDIRAKSYTFSGNIWICKSKSGSGQTLLVANISYTYGAPPPKTESISVKKVWEDDYNIYGNRPENIQVDLKKNDSATGDSIKLSSANQSGNASNVWTGKFTGLNSTTGYTVAEKTVPDGYDAKITGNVKDGFTITNKLKTTSITVKKIWDDNSNSEGKRPDSITISIFGNDTWLKDIKLSGTGDEWSQKVEGLPQYIDGKKVEKYTAEEITVTGYTTTIEESSSQIVITNTYIEEEEPPETTQVTVNKVWEDDNNSAGDRPDAIDVIITANELNLTRSVRIHADDGWTYTWSDVLKYTDNGTLVTFTVKEEGVPEERYTTEITQGENNVFTITNTYIPEEIVIEKTQVTVTKKWVDTNHTDKRPSSITVQLLADGENTGKSMTLSEGAWTGTFTDLDKNKEDGTEIKYAIQEISKIPGYSSAITGDMATGYIITNTYIGDMTLVNEHKPERVQLTITKKWNDSHNGVEDFDELRPEYVEITLLADGQKLTVDADENPITNPIRLSEANGWTYTYPGTFFKYKHVGQLIQYSITETPFYTSKNDRREYPYNNPSNTPASNVIGTSLNTYSTIETQTNTALYGAEIIVTNTHEPEYDGYIEITGTVWVDGNGGKANDINGKLGDDIDLGLAGTKVRLIDGNNNKIKIKAAYYSGNRETGLGYVGNDYATTDSKGNYTIRVNYKKGDVYSIYENRDDFVNDLNNDLEGIDDTSYMGILKHELETAYVQFEYDGLMYTTVAPSDTGLDTSKAQESEYSRNTLDRNYSKITYGTDPAGWQTNITANTKNFSNYNDTDEVTKGLENNITSSERVKYCNGNGTVYRTKYDDTTVVLDKSNYTCTECTGSTHTKSFNVGVLQYSGINLGLFVREQPDVALFTDLTKVEVKMNNQQYTYLYGVRGTESDAQGMQFKFQNGGTYTYKRPVNPADISYINDTENSGISDIMEVFVTYQIKVANLATSVRAYVDDLIFYYDSRYALQSNVGDWNISSVTLSDGTTVNKATNKSTLNISVDAQKESSPIELKFKVDYNTLLGLKDGVSPLNFAAEIASYRSIYGRNTLYAEQRTGGRTDKLYGGYDYNSHPGNVTPQQRLFKDTGKNIIDIRNREDDEDVAPSFLLQKDDEIKILAGTVFEDTQTKDITVDHTIDDDERLGNGKMDTGENVIQAVKIEILNLDGTKAKRYALDGTDITNEPIYTGANGAYDIPGIVTGNYYISFEYGNTDGIKTIINNTEGQTVVDDMNARNYKSTIITDPLVKDIMNKNFIDGNYDVKWHINHEDGYSTAVDDMNLRLSIGELTYGSYEDGQNMTANTKEFASQVEFDPNGQKQVNGTTSEENGIKIVDGEIGVTKRLEKLDFGIIERPREDLIVQKTIKYFSITLANGQVLVEGNPSEQTKINYTKLMGFGKAQSAELARQNLGDQRRLLVEIDNEIIQGAELKVKYDIQVYNNNEVDYDYGESFEYTDIQGEGNHISKSSKAKYYYFGDNSGLAEMKSQVKFVDYLSKELAYTEDDKQWQKISAEDLKNRKLISGINPDVCTEVTKAEYQTFISEGAEPIPIERNVGFISARQMSVSKLLTSEDENVFDNHVEIISIDGKTGRTKIGDDSKKYTPGNYVPATDYNEYDDDEVEIIITPPTGLVTNIITYSIIILIGLIILFIGIKIIKKKVLIK